MGSVHGGAFWAEVGNDLAKLSDVIRADVLDAWFPPAPEIREVLSRYSVDLCQTSPEARANPLRAAISAARQIPIESVLTGAGSSALIFLALPWIAEGLKQAVVLDPTYGEYRHVLESLCGLKVNGVPLSRESGYLFDPERLLRMPGDLAVIVNPNSPTGRYVRPG